MLKYTDYDIVFQEIPDETTLALNLSNCPHRCKGCHSHQLQQDTGEILTKEKLASFIDNYQSSITCVCFMGGDSDMQELCSMASFVASKWNGKIKTAWYSGYCSLSDIGLVKYFDFIKLGRYIEELGGLKSVTTNQRLYRIENGKMNDITYLFQRTLS